MGSVRIAPRRDTGRPEGRNVRCSGFFSDTHKLAEALDRLGIAYTWHKVVPFIGKLDPDAVVADKHDVVMFGSYSLWRTAATEGIGLASSRFAPSSRRRPGIHISSTAQTHGS
ncbi:hypothetical protein FHT76_001783 [Rhizobium sp. BK176]|nr:hypothetical protein [Rhizobium sp. BK176]